MLTASSNNSASSRNLVVCIDGTSNKFGRKVIGDSYLCLRAQRICMQNTNVVKLYRRIQLDSGEGSEPRQHAYYSSGIGTHAKNLPFLHRVEKAISDSLDMALAWSVFTNLGCLL